jgi:aminoethylphosphonate catabolism LysR family transcriptional regulator
MPKKGPSHMKFTYAQIRAFNAVARDGSFSKAAANLGVTQPAITLQVRALEDLYSVVLFVRTRESAKLTKLGLDLFQVTQSLQIMETDVDDLLSRQSELTQGSLSVAAGSPQLLMPLIKRYNQKYPNVKISMQLGNFDEVETALLQNRVDVAILDGPITNDRFHEKLYLQQELMLVVPADHRLAQFDSVRPDDLSGETILVRGDGSYTQKTMDSWFRRARAETASTLQMSNRDAIIEAASCGIGVGFVFDKEVGRDPRIVKIRLSGRTTRCDESLVCLKSQFRRRTIKALFELLPKTV